MPESRQGDDDLAHVRFRRYELELHGIPCVRIMVRDSVSKGPQVAVLEGRSYELIIS